MEDKILLEKVMKDSRQGRFRGTCLADLEHDTLKGNYISSGYWTNDPILAVSTAYKKAIDRKSQPLLIQFEGSQKMGVPITSLEIFRMDDEAEIEKIIQECDEKEYLKWVFKQLFEEYMLKNNLHQNS